MADNDAAIAKLAAARLAGKDISTALLSVAEAAAGLLESGLTQRAIIILLRGLIGVGPDKPNQTEIGLVLDALPKLKEYVEGGE